jgi:hypothetical protein
MAQVDSENTTAMPVDPTRRRFITIAAAGAAAIAATAPGIADVAEPDPIFAAIGAFRRADAACVAVNGDIPDEVGNFWSEAISTVLRTRPTTPAGLAALTTFSRERADWLKVNGTGCGDDFCMVSATIDDATRGMSGLEPWSPPLLAATAVSADPAVALIAEKRAIDVAYCSAIDAQDAAEGRFGSRSDEAWEAAEHCETACVAANEIEWRLAGTMPTTLAGVAAVLRFANQIEDENGEWPNTDTIGPDGWHYQLRATMAAALEALLKAQGAKAVQS